MISKEKGMIGILEIPFYLKCISFFFFFSHIFPTFFKFVILHFIWDSFLFSSIILFWFQNYIKLTSILIQIHLKSKKWFFWMFVFIIFPLLKSKSPNSFFFLFDYKNFWNKFKKKNDWRISCKSTWKTSWR